MDSLREADIDLLSSSEFSPEKCEHAISNHKHTNRKIANDFQM